ncbi:MAG: glycosyltransferase [Armatimonadota bacterium]
MRIVCANNYLYLRGGCERVMFEEAEMLRRRDNTVLFFSRHQAWNISTDHQELFPPYIDPETLPAFRKFQHISRIIYNADTYRRFNSFLRELRPDLIHAHNIYGGLTTAVCDAAKHRSIPMVMTLHDYKLICPSYLMLNDGKPCEACSGGRFLAAMKNRCHKGSLAYSTIYCLESFINRWLKKYESVAMLICPSRFLLHKMVESGIDPVRLHYLPNSIDIEQYLPAIGRGQYALFVGRLSREKGIMTLLQAIRQTAIPLGILGDGPLREEVTEFVRRHNLADRVTVYGYQTGDALRTIYRNAAFVVVPSEWYENAPMTILEAFAYGKPVVGAGIGGIPEMIEEGQTGMLFPPGAVDALSACLNTLWSRYPRGDLGRHARECVETMFSPAGHVKGLLEIYRQAIG